VQPMHRLLKKSDARKRTVLNVLLDLESLGEIGSTLKTWGFCLWTLDENQLHPVFLSSERQGQHRVPSTTSAETVRLQDVFVHGDLMAGTDIDRCTKELLIRKAERTLASLSNNSANAHPMISAESFERLMRVVTVSCSPSSASIIQILEPE
jgi:hypothetical protein